jgi:alpha-tubulin suppressor-like RCC1 family protein
MATTTYPYTQYSGIWTMQQVNAAIAAGTWPSPPGPSLLAWGLGTSGQLGLGNTTSYSSPKQVGTLKTWSTVAAGNISSAAIKTDGTLWTWGGNTYGQLGTNNTTSVSSPVQIGALTNWSSASSSASNGTFAIKSNNTLWSWGQNDNGQLGTSNTTYYSSPKQIGALTNWAQVVGGHQYTLAVKTDNTLWGWGYTFGGQIGNGSSGFGTIQSPVQVGAAISWNKTYAGYFNSYGVSTSGALWSWGFNNYGQLGLGNTTDYSSPKQIGSLTDWLDVAGYYGWAVAVKTNGTIWGWGRNQGGQLGLGNTTSYSSPKQIGALTSWVKIYAGKGPAGVLAIKNDGTLWAWGVNNNGQLGLGNTTYYSSPKQVGTGTNWLSASLSGNALAIANI